MGVSHYLRWSFSELREAAAAQIVAATPSARHSRRSSHLKSTASPAGGTAGSHPGSGSLSSICAMSRMHQGLTESGNTAQS